MVSRDGTSGFQGENISGQVLDETVMYHGDTLPTAGTNDVPANGLFQLNKSKAIYENTNTKASPTWTVRVHGTSFGTDTNSLVAGENLAVNEAVMVDGNLTIKKLTSAKAGQCIGVMLKAVSNTVTINPEDIEFYGIVTMIAGATVVAGDRLIGDTGTAGRVIKQNTDPTTHLHEAFTVGALQAGGAPIGFSRITSGEGNILEDSGGRPGGFAVIAGSGATFNVCNTDAKTIGFTHGTIIAKALEGATVGNTFLALLCLSG